MSDIEVRELHDMHALSHAGNYVAAAYQDGRMVGTSIAFPSARPPTRCTRISPAPWEATGAGLALKLHQRRWALQRRSRITWTYETRWSAATPTST